MRRDEEQESFSVAIDALFNELTTGKSEAAGRGMIVKDAQLDWSVFRSFLIRSKKTDGSSTHPFLSTADRKKFIAASFTNQTFLSRSDFHKLFSPSDENLQPLQKPLTVSVAKVLRASTADAIEFSPSLVDVSLVGINLQTFPIEVITGCPLLLTLNVSRNSLPSLPAPVFSHPRLRTLNASSNSISTLPQVSTSFASRLKRLNLSKNRIESLPNSIATSLYCLRDFDLSENPIANQLIGSTLYTSGLVGLYSFLRARAEVLYNNDDDELQRKAQESSGLYTSEVINDFIKSSEGLDTLNLSNLGSPIVLSNKSRFSGYSTNLVYLNLSRNHISIVPDWIFTTFPHLTMLNLSHNDIKVLKSMFSTTLKVLRLRENDIESLPTEELDAMPSLNVLDIRDNPRLVISNSEFGKNIAHFLFDKQVYQERRQRHPEVNFDLKISNEMKRRILERGKHFNGIEANQRVFVQSLVSCNLKSLADVSSSQQTQFIRVLDLSHNLLTECNCNSFLENLKHLKQLILRHNKLSSLKGIEKCKGLTRLDVSYNCLTALEMKVLLLPKLESLNAAFNQITNIVLPKKVETLRHIHLVGNNALPETLVRTCRNL